MSEFQTQLLEQARSHPAKVLLPEATEPRILRAAQRAAESGVAHPVLLGDEAEIRAVGSACGVALHENISIAPADQRREHWAARLIELRSHRPPSQEQALSMVQSPLYESMLMLREGEVQGVVAGAVSATADVLRPALQLIPKSADSRLASSSFIMCMPTGPVLYADCSLNTQPTPEQLAGIAVDSARTAEAFGLSPKVAMLSYSTGDSGSGPLVDAIQEATDLARELAPELQLEGPIQYDAALRPQVAAIKCPESPVAGQANVLVFPNLDAGNIAYKAVQHAAGVISIGPILQGLSKPVNDLSRGATEDDIYYTIGVTSLQARFLGA